MAFISGTHATVKVYARSATLSPDFLAAIQAAEAKLEQRFYYLGSQYQIDTGGVFTTMPDIYAALPTSFSNGELEVNSVQIQASVIPTNLPAKPGWYVGANHSYPSATVMVDLDGRLTRAKPCIYANGDQYDEVIAFYKLVMTGGIEPGDQFCSIHT